MVTCENSSFIPGAYIYVNFNAQKNCLNKLALSEVNAFGSDDSIHRYVNTGQISFILLTNGIMANTTHTHANIFPKCAN